LVANGKRRKSHIFQLEDGDRIIKGEDPLKSYIVDYYKNLFGPSDSGMFSLDEDNRDDITQISPEDNEKNSCYVYRARCEGGSLQNEA
jgi:hypothetical protein